MAQLNITPVYGRRWLFQPMRYTHSYNFLKKVCVTKKVLYLCVSNNQLIFNEMKHPEQLIKEYFPEFPTKMRKDFLSRMKHLSNDLLEAECKALRARIDTDKANAMPVLLHSIATNSLGFEYNEQLKKTCYMDYSNKNISNHAKGFISGQYKIFRNEHEALILEQGENIGAVIDRLDNAVKLMIEMGVVQMIDFEPMLEAFKKDPKSVMGIVRKVNAK